MSSPCYSCAKNFTWNSTMPCLCTVTFRLDQPFENNVFMYYGLSNFYQSHRRYVSSRDDSQLTGDLSALKNPNKVCEPYHTSGGLPIAPCGAVANSLFNDTLELYYIDNGTRNAIPGVKKGIAWWTDKCKKFRNPGGNKNLTIAFKGTTKPISWRKAAYELDPYDPRNNGFINEDLLVWMRTAAFPTFHKLYRIIQKKPNMAPTLPSGHYELDITYNYPVLSFNGRKRMILSTTSWMGGKNPFLGIAHITMGSVYFSLGVVLLIYHRHLQQQQRSSKLPQMEITCLCVQGRPWMVRLDCLRIFSMVMPVSTHL